MSGRPYVRCRSGGGSSRAMRRTRVARDGPAPSLTQRGRAMHQESAIFVGLDASKLKISVALAEDGRQGEVRFLGDIEHTPEAVRRLVTKLAGQYRRRLFCSEAGPTGYGLQRQISALGHDCAVIAPSLIPKRPGERVKTKRRDAVTLARLHRAGELTRIWVPDPGHEAVRELCGLVRQRWRTCARSASICNPFCCATVASSRAVSPGRGPMRDGWRSSPSSIQRSIWCGMSTGRPSKMPKRGLNG